MKSTNQTLLVTVAVIFAVALALTVSLICLATSPETVLLAAGTPAAEVTVTQAPVPVTTEPPAIADKGLIYRSLGNNCTQLISVGSCTDACITIPEHIESGEKVTSIASCAFQGCRTLAALQIPASVTEIGDLAFSDCPRLMYLSVNSENPAFQDFDGILYTKGGTRLILYPPMHTGDSVTLPVTLTSIAEKAFYRCTFLTSVIYEGTAENWEAISIEPRNYSLTAAAKRFREE